ncbi:hypothetical protein BCR44DRAFT_1423987, partial [Catenaria anguillulae PL171]
PVYRFSSDLQSAVDDAIKKGAIKPLSGPKAEQASQALDVIELQKIAVAKAGPGYDPTDVYKALYANETVVPARSFKIESGSKPFQRGTSLAHVAWPPRIASILSNSNQRNGIPRRAFVCPWSWLVVVASHHCSSTRHQRQWRRLSHSPRDSSWCHVPAVYRSNKGALVGYWPAHQGRTCCHGVHTC